MLSQPYYSAYLSGSTAQHAVELVCGRSQGSQGDVGSPPLQMNELTVRSVFLSSEKSKFPFIFYCSWLI